MTASPQVFLSYAREDRAVVLPFYERVASWGFRPWMDARDLVGGERWAGAVQKAAKVSDFVVVFLSPRSVDKRGFLQREIKQALSQWEDKLDDDVYLIPVRLEPCDVPDSLADFQWVDLFEDGGAAGLHRALRVGLERRGLQPPAPSSSFETRTRTESKSGAVDYDISVEYPHFAEAEPWSREVNEVVVGLVADVFLNARKDGLVGLRDTEWGARLGDFRSMNSTDVTYRVTLQTDQLLSVEFTTYWYGAGAAHGNYGTTTLNFSLQPVVPLRIIDLCLSDVEPFAVLSERCRAELIRQEAAILLSLEPAERDGDTVRAEVNVRMIEAGTAPEPENFEAFVLGEDALTIYFDPYHAGPYALGRREVKVPYEELFGVIDPEGPLAPLIARLPSDIEGQ